MRRIAKTHGIAGRSLGRSFLAPAVRLTAKKSGRGIAAKGCNQKALARSFAGAERTVHANERMTSPERVLPYFSSDRSVCFPHYLDERPDIIAEFLHRQLLPVARRIAGHESVIRLPTPSAENARRRSVDEHRAGSRKPERIGRDRARAMRDLILKHTPGGITPCARRQHSHCGRRREFRSHTRASWQLSMERVVTPLRPVAITTRHQRAMPLGRFVRRVSGERKEVWLPCCWSTRMTGG